MKIYTRVEHVWDELQGCFVLSDFDCFDYQGTVSLCTGVEEAAAVSEGAKAAGSAAAASEAGGLGLMGGELGSMGTAIGGMEAGGIGAGALAAGDAGLGLMGGELGSMGTAAGEAVSGGMGLGEMGGELGSMGTAASGLGSDIGASPALADSMSTGSGASGSGASANSPALTESLSSGSGTGSSVTPFATAPEDAMLTGKSGGVAETGLQTASESAGAPSQLESSVANANSLSPTAETTTFSPGSTGQAIQDAINKLSSTLGTDGAMSALTKYGPLATQLISKIQSGGLSQKYASKMGNIGSTQRDTANQMIQQAQSGQINSSDQYAIDQWKQSATAQAKAYYAKAGLSDSSMATQAIADINSQAEAKYEAARQSLLKTGMDALNVVDKYQQAAVNAEMQGDQNAAKQSTDFLSAYGSWLRGQNGSTDTAKQS